MVVKLRLMYFIIIMKQFYADRQNIIYTMYKL